MIPRWRFLLIAIAALLFPSHPFAQRPVAGKNLLTVRGQEQEIYYYPAQTSAPLNQKVLFVPGDRGWGGFAITIAETAASWGYDVYGLDTRRYLEGFTSKTAYLKETEVMQDFRQIAQWISGGKEQRIVLLGWSEGAGLCLLAAASEQNRDVFRGLISLGLGETSVLAWRWSDVFSTLAHKDALEPQFASALYMPRVAPLPLLMIQSSHDEFAPAAEAQKLFALAREPKRFALIEAKDHRFDGNHDEFFRTLHEGLEWIRAASP